MQIQSVFPKYTWVDSEPAAYIVKTQLTVLIMLRLLSNMTSSFSCSKASLRSLVLLSVAFLFGTSTAQALRPSDIFEVSSIILSKNCPIPDGPDLLREAPDMVIKSATDPSCPKRGDEQLVQVTVKNKANMAQSVGVEIEVSRNDQIIESFGLRKILTLESVDIARLLHSITLDEGGRYRVTARIWDTEFDQMLAEAGAGVKRQFFIATPDDIAAAKEQMTQEQEQGIRAVPKPLKFDPPDLRFDHVQIIPKHVLRGEKFRIRLNLTNVGGDIVRDINNRVEYYNVRRPRRRFLIATPYVGVVAPGETVTFDLEYVLPDDQLLGSYQLLATVDPDNQIKELKENNNEIQSAPIRMSDIKLLLPVDNFLFDEKGLFLFQWDSLVFGEFKVQIGVDPKFENPDAYFDLPQGDRWIADKELVPLAGELPGMAQGLMQSLDRNKVYWRVIGRQSSGRQAVSDVLSFSIKTAQD